MVLKNYSKQCT